MAGLIPQTFIDDLIARVDIVDVIDERVPLRKQGSNYTARCPFHDEKSPSFSVSPEKQFYYCFGCGAHGTAIGFLMDYAHMDFPDAIRELASRVGLEVPEEEGSRAKILESKPLYDVLEQASQFYAEQLRSHAQSERAVEYLKSRGLSGQTAADFGIGYAPPGWDNLLKALGKDDSQKKLLEQAGLTIVKDEGGHYDRFRDRIIFPIHDRRGRVIGFGGRTLGDDKPKYLNSPETAVFHKGRELYGLFQALKSRDKDRLIVVEGYTDVVSLAQFGIPYATATLGTATTPDHVGLLFRHTPHIVFCFDGDAAGKKAAWRAMENTLAKLGSGRQASFLFLPEGEDPDSVIRQHGEDDFKQRIEKASSLSDFLFNTISAKHDMDSIDGRARLVDQARPMLEKIPEGSFRDLMFAHLDKIAGTNLASTAPPRPKPRASSKVFRETGRRPSTVRIAIALLLRKPALADLVADSSPLASLDKPGVHLLLELMAFVREHPETSCAGILENWRGTETGGYLVKLAAMEELCPEDGLETEFLGAIDRLLALLADERVERLLEKDRVDGLSSEEKQELKSLLASGSAHTPTIE